MTGLETGKIRMFPNYFKIIGLVLSVVLLVWMVFGQTVINVYFPIEGEIYHMSPNLKTLFKILILIGFLFICWSKEKHEDERTMKLRMKAMSIAFLLTVAIMVGQYIIYVARYSIDDNAFRWLPMAFGTMLKIMLIYLVSFRILKR